MDLKEREMLRIGCHLSSAKGYLAMGKEAVRIGANTFQFFTRNPRGGKVKPLDTADLEAYVSFAEEHNIGKVLAHAPYTMNACARDEGLREFVYETMCDDLSRLEYLPEGMYNFHPGNHVKQGIEVGIDYISEMINRINERGYKSTILLETMAGKGTEIGRNFEEIQAIIEKVEDTSRLGVCMDTCHVFDGGYDIVNHLEQVLHQFNEVIGSDRLKAIHLNDSKNILGSHKDRHEKIGEGNIGFTAFKNIINHPQLRELPFFLETPNELEGYAKEIALLKKYSMNEEI